MAAVKEQVIQMIQNMPRDISVEDIMAELYFRYRVDEGLKHLDEGKGITHEKVERRMAQWLHEQMGRQGPSTVAH